LKWYQKALYSAAMAVLPANVKAQMLGVGRMTVPSNANPWSMFNWLPKKFQTAHTLDLTKLQSYTAEELIELLISVHPDVSHAIHTYLRMGDTEMSMEADNEGAQSTMDALVEMLNTALPSPGYQHGRSLDKLDGIQRLMVMVRGACAGEVVLNAACNDVIDIVPVDPALIWFKREPDTNRLIPWQFVKYPKYDQQAPGEWFGQYKRIDTPTFIYEELDPLVDDPYGRNPILPALQVVFFHIQVLQDLKAVVHNQGYPRMTVSLLEELMLKNMPAPFKNDPNAQRTWLSQRLTDTQTMMQNLNPDDALIGFDSVKYDYVRGGGGPVVDVTKLINVIDTQLATSLKTLLTLLSRHQGSTETYSSVDTQIYIKTVESARSITKRFWARSFSIAARVKGVQTTVDVDYAPIDLRSEQQQENDRKSFIENIESADSNFYITPEEAAEQVRRALGLDVTIPPELADKLKTKHDPVATPTQENPSVPPTPPPTANSRMKLSADPQQTSELQTQQEFISVYISLMGYVRDQVKHATTIDAIKASLFVSSGVATQLQRALFVLYRQAYVDSYNARAIASGTARIRFPDTQTSVELQMQASRVFQGINETYQSEMENALQQAITDASSLPESEQLAHVKKEMSDWADQRMAYKSQEVAQYESGVAYHKGMIAHDEVHFPETMYSVQPTTTEHEACAEIIAGAPYTVDEAKSVTLPLHPHCPHMLVPIPPEGGDN